MSTNVKLQPSQDVLKFKENVEGNIELTKPIELVFEKNTQPVAPVSTQINQSQKTTIVTKPNTNNSGNEISFQKPKESATKAIKIEKTKLQSVPEPIEIQMQTPPPPEPPNAFNTKMIQREAIKPTIKIEETKVINAPPPPPAIPQAEMTKIIESRKVTEIKNKTEVQSKVIKLDTSKLKSNLQNDEPKLNLNTIQTNKNVTEPTKTGIAMPSIVKTETKAIKPEKIEIEKSKIDIVIESNSEPLIELSRVDIQSPHKVEQNQNVNQEPVVSINQTKIEEVMTSSVAQKFEVSKEVETLKSYLALREQDVAVMKLQVDYAKEELNKAQHSIKSYIVENENLEHQLKSYRDQLDNFKKQKNKNTQSFDQEVDRYKIEIRLKADQIKQMDEKLQAAIQEQELLKERVKLDIRKIRVREKELETKLEILKRDSETLIVSRENKIVELKRKIDLLEFNYDMLQEKYEKEKQNHQELLNKEQELAKVLKKALGLGDEDSEIDFKKIKSA